MLQTNLTVRRIVRECLKASVIIRVPHCSYWKAGCKACCHSLAVSHCVPNLSPRTPSFEYLCILLAVICTIRFAYFRTVSNWKYCWCCAWFYTQNEWFLEHLDEVKGLPGKHIHTTLNIYGMQNSRAVPSRGKVYKQNAVWLQETKNTDPYFLFIVRYIL